ncbi:hypothetical protein OPQ81_003613 [Rhizoctonia solani]|nr:hypothetical protein OPQ81_003613 [Rhizoctonia solani]
MSSNDGSERTGRDGYRGKVSAAVVATKPPIHPPISATASSTPLIPPSIRPSISASIPPSVPASTPPPIPLAAEDEDVGVGVGVEVAPTAINEGVEADIPPLASNKDFKVHVPPTVINEDIKVHVPPVISNDDIKVDVLLPSGATAVETISNRSSKLHALIIGINDYPNISKLRGAVADAEEVARFLESDLKVLPNQIIKLLDSAATRKNIINAIEELWATPKIEYDDPILIYYAGHGGSRNATEEWKGKKGAHRVQVIFPYDYDEIDSSSKPIECIPDRTIAGLLNKLSQVKGDNITVIFDSCHSASGTRNLQRPKKVVWYRLERSAEVKRDIPWEIDSDIVHPELGVVPPPKEDEKDRYIELPLCTDQTSHIHLAACGSGEKAWEEDGRGVFTMALLKSIRANGVDKISYHNLIKSLPSLSSQSPHCYGKHQTRILFNSGVPSTSTLIVPVEFDEENKQAVLQAGAASGVTTGSIWEVYHTVTGGYPARGGDELYLTYVYEAGHTESPEASGTRTFARQIRAGVTDELRVYFTHCAKNRIFPAGEVERTTYTVGSGALDVGYVMHASEDSADIIVDLHSEVEVTFRLCDRQAEKCNVALLPKRVKAERQAVETVLFAAAKWKWHLQRKNTESGEITDLVSMELISLGEKQRESRVRKIYSEEERKIMNDSGIVDFETSSWILYGVKLTSRVKKPLYIRMFYFDTTDFSIDDLFGHEVGKDPVMTGETFVIGAGGDGGSPHRFEVDPEKKVELGYMKVFWSTTPLELNDLEQKPVFDRQSRKWNRLRGCDLFVGEGVEWGTVLLTLVQRLPDENK